MLEVSLTGHTKGIGEALHRTLSNKFIVKGYSRSNGYDISSPEGRHHIFESSKHSDIFINNAFYSNSQTELLQKSVNVEFNQIQFSATNFEAMLDGSLDFMQLHNIKPMAWNPLGSMYKENTEQTRRLKKLLTTLVSKYEVSSDLILLAWILQHPSNIIPAVGTTNLTRIPQLNKASSLKLDLEDWFAIWTESMGNRVP